MVLAAALGAAAGELARRHLAAVGYRGGKNRPDRNRVAGVWVPGPSGAALAR
jgi:hypothetical protein